MKQPSEIKHDSRTVEEIINDDANLRGANLRGADLHEADLHEADLRWADLHEADLRWADLRWADLHEADLRGANLRGANLRGANLRGADLPPTTITPENGSFTAYKATQENIIELEIPEDANRLTPYTSRKCRASKSSVLEILDEDGEPCSDTRARGKRDSDFIYREGETVEPDGYDDDKRVVCSNGIHFFMTKDEAIDWV